MDLNELLHAHQVEVMRASAAGDDEGRQLHFAEVANYAAQIQALRTSRKGYVPLLHRAAREIDMHVTNGQHLATNASTTSLNVWESEGGSINPPNSPLPAGIAERLVREYRVGPYKYTDLSQAIAENTRQQSRPLSVL
ncbi:hypothetical protein ACXYL9_09190 [Qipengyuania sp. CAU 1752]